MSKRCADTDSGKPPGNPTAFQKPLEQLVDTQIHISSFLRTWATDGTISVRQAGQRIGDVMSVKSANACDIASHMQSVQDVTVQVRHNDIVAPVPRPLRQYTQLIEH